MNNPEKYITYLIFWDFEGKNTDWDDENIKEKIKKSCILTNCDYDNFIIKQNENDENFKNLDCKLFNYLDIYETEENNLENKIDELEQEIKEIFCLNVGFDTVNLSNLKYKKV